MSGTCNEGQPKGWTLARLEEVAIDEPHSLVDGPFGSKLKTAHYTDAGPRVIRLQNVGECEFIDQHAHISTEHFQALERHNARAGDVIIATLGDRLPRACCVPEWLGPAIVKADCPRLRVDSQLATPEFVAYALNSDQTRRRAKSLVHGVGRQRLNLRSLRALDTPLAPLPEQHRIVAALDSYFSRLDAAEKALERVQANLKRYRASVLKAAVEGRLVPTEAELARREGKEYEPAEKLLERILVERRKRWEEAELEKMRAKGKEPKDDKWKAKYREPEGPDLSELPDLPEDWCWATLEQLALPDVGFAFKSREFSSEGMRLLRGDNIEPGQLRWKNAKYWPESKLGGFEHLLVKEGDLILAMDRPLISNGLKLAVARRSDVPCLLVQRVARLRGLEGLSPFLRLSMLTKRFVQHLSRNQTGTQLPHVSMSGIASFAVPLPPAQVVQRIVQVSEELLSEADAATLSVTQGLRRIARLRQSILKWAFEGKLVGQDPEDESASVLLERIRAERAAGKPARRKREGGRS